MRERTPPLWARRSEEKGEAGLVDRRLGKASGRRAPADRGEEGERLDRARYPGFTVKPFPEPVIKEPGFGWSYDVDEAASSVGGRRVRRRRARAPTVASASAGRRRG